VLGFDLAGLFGHLVCVAVASLDLPVWIPFFLVAGVCLFENLIFVHFFYKLLLECSSCIFLNKFRCFPVRLPENPSLRVSMQGLGSSGCGLTFSSPQSAQFSMSVLGSYEVDPLLFFQGLGTSVTV